MNSCHKESVYNDSKTPAVSPPLLSLSWYAARGPRARERVRRYEPVSREKSARGRLRRDERRTARRQKKKKITKQTKLTETTVCSESAACVSTRPFVCCRVRSSRAWNGRRERERESVVGTTAAGNRRSLPRRKNAGGRNAVAGDTCRTRARRVVARTAVAVYGRVIPRCRYLPREQQQQQLVSTAATKNKNFVLLTYNWK